MLFNFVAVFNGSKLRSGEKSDICDCVVIIAGVYRYTVASVSEQLS